eukprot:gene6445-7108_t
MDPFESIDSVDAFGGSGIGRPNRTRKSKASFDDVSYDLSDSNSSDMKKKKKKVGSKASVDTKKLELSPRQSLPAPPGTSHVFPFILSPAKRPRGRPPLIAKRPPIMSFHHSILPSAVPCSPPVMAPPPVIPIPPPPPPPSKVAVASTAATAPPATEESGTGTATTTKAPRPPYKQVLERLIALLMTNDPLTLQELSKSMDDCPKDMIQSAVDVLQVFGIVMQVKAKQGFRSDCQAGTILYCLVGFAKGPVAVELEKVVEETTSRREMAARSNHRLAELHELANREMSEENRLQSFNSLLRRFQREGDDDLNADPLYRCLFSELEKKG